MTPSDPNPDDPVLLVSTLQQLRRRAMDRQREVSRVPPQLAEGMTPEDVQLLFHELRVHQVELEVQHEE